MLEDRSSIEKSLREEYHFLFVELSEKGRRKWAALQAKKLGHGGKGIVHRATGLAYKTIQRGLAELTSGEELPAGRIRQKGGGRKRLTERYPDIEKSLSDLVEGSTRGDPEKVLKWTNKSVAHLHEQLVQQGYHVSPMSVYNLLDGLGYTLQANKKTKAGGEHPDRDAQFAFINTKAKQFRNCSPPSALIFF